jgi:hypothetical protein
LGKAFKRSRLTRAGRWMASLAKKKEARKP